MEVTGEETMRGEKEKARRREKVGEGRRGRGEGKADIGREGGGEEREGGGKATRRELIEEGVRTERGRRGGRQSGKERKMK